MSPEVMFVNPSLANSATHPRATRTRFPASPEVMFVNPSLANSATHSRATRTRFPALQPRPSAPAQRTAGLGTTYVGDTVMADRRRLTFPRRRCDSPVMIRLLKEIYK